MPLAIFRVPYPPVLPELQYPRPDDPTHVNGGYSCIGEVRASDSTCLIQVDSTQENLDLMAIDFEMLSQADVDIDKVVEVTSEERTLTALGKTRASLQDFRMAGGHTLEDKYKSLESKGLIPLCDSQGRLIIDASHNLIYVRKDGENE
jgi:hypothetical protein